MDIENSFRILSLDEIIGFYNLDIFKYYGLQAEITDFANNTSCVPDFKDNNKIYGMWITKIKEEENNNILYVINQSGTVSTESLYIKDAGIRPVIDYSLIKKDSIVIKEVNKDIFEIEYGYYPRNYVSKKENKKLLKKLKKELMQKTGNSYVLDQNNKDVFIPHPFFEYIFEGKKYIILNNYFTNYKPFFIEVEPLRWIVDKKNNIAITKEIVFSNVKYNDKNEDDFTKTHIYKFLNTYFAKDITQNIKNKSETIEYLNTMDVNCDAIMKLELCGSKVELENILKLIKEQITNVEVKGLERIRKDGNK